MTWEPTHVQLTVLRARNLVGKLKGKGSAKITDVFVTIGLGKEKFQTSTIKYGGKVNNGVEWFEECDLAIPSMTGEVEVLVMNRGLLSDEFIGHVIVPLKQFDVYERPKSHWVQLGQKPSKLPDGRCRGELEVRLTFHVKSKNEDIASTGSLKNKRSGSIKSLVSAMGRRLSVLPGDTLDSVGSKFSRRSSLRGESGFSSPQPHKKKNSRRLSLTAMFNAPGISNRRASLGGIFSNPMRDDLFKNTSTKTSPYSGNPVKFDAVDLYVPEQCWRETDFQNDLGDGNFARSYSLTSDKRRNNKDYKSRSLMNLPGEHSLTLPSHGRSRQRPSLDDSAIGQSRTSSRSSRNSVTSQEGYLESIFKKECEVDDRMNDAYNDNIEEESEDDEGEPYRRRTAHVFDESLESGSDSESTSAESELEDQQISLPKVRLKSNGSGRNYSEHNGSHKSSIELESDNVKGIHAKVTQCSSIGSVGDEQEKDMFDGTISPSDYTTELDRVIAREQSRSYSNTLNSHGTSDGHTSTHTSSSSIGYQGKSAAERAFERGSTDSMSAGSRKKISPQGEFTFSLTSQTSYDDSLPVRRKSKQYAKGGRRYTVHGFEGFSTHRSAPDIRDQRPVLNRDDSIPGDLMAVYRNMNREELIKLVVTHKAQLIRKDQYLKELENYIDNLLVRVMESSPRILQNL